MIVNPTSNTIFIIICGHFSWRLQFVLHCQLVPLDRKPSIAKEGAT